MPDTSPMSPDNWLRDLFASKAVQQGQVVRRKTRDIDRFARMAPFLDELHKRGFRAVETRGQVVIFCNREPIRRIA